MSTPIPDSGLIIVHSGHPNRDVITPELSKIYFNLCQTTSDINEHLPILRNLSAKYDNVVEFGVRWIVSTYALLAGRPSKLTSVDVIHPAAQGADIKIVENLAKDNFVDFNFIQESTLNANLFDECDMLFIDTLHHYKQLKTELYIHAHKVKKCIVFHDIISFGHGNEGDYLKIKSTNVVTQAYIESLKDEQGIRLAVVEFMKEHPEWYVEDLFSNNNGLLILKRKEESQNEDQSILNT